MSQEKRMNMEMEKPLPHGRQKVDKELYCHVCGESLEEGLGYVRAPGDPPEYLCTPCSSHGLTRAILKYPISGAGED